MKRNEVYSFIVGVTLLLLVARIVSGELDSYLVYLIPILLIGGRVTLLSINDVKFKLFIYIVMSTLIYVIAYFSLINLEYSSIQKHILVSLFLIAMIALICLSLFFNKKLGSKSNQM